MTESTPVESLRFVTDDLAYVEAGRDFRAGVRLYDAAVTGRIQLLVDETELLVDDVAPAAFDVSETVGAMYRALAELESTDTVRTMPFCCLCGTRACAYIRWQLECLEGDEEVPNGNHDGSDGDRAATVRLTIETLAGDPIGEHRYDVARPTLEAAVADLVAAVLETFEQADAVETDAGTIAEVREWERRLRADGCVHEGTDDGGSEQTDDSVDGAAGGSDGERVDDGASGRPDETLVPRSSDSSRYRSH